MVIALLTSVNFIAADFVDDKTITISSDQTKEFPKEAPVYRPVFWKADANTTELVERYDTNSTGAVIKADLYSNVTIWYTFVGGDNTSAPLLFGDDGLSTPGSLSWIEGILMTYDNETTVTKNDGLGYYNYTLNMSSHFVVFRARYGLFEDEVGVPNIITTGVWINSSFIQDFYTQYDEIDMDLKLRKYNITSYGLLYRVIETDSTEPDYSTTFDNITIPYVEDGTDISKTLNASFANIFPVGTELDVRGFITQYDNVTQQERIFHENDADFVTINDGDPQMTLTHTRFTNSLNVSISWEAEAPKVNITSVEIDWNDTVTDTYYDLAKSTAYHLYSANGEYKIEVTAYAYAASITKTVKVLIEDELPTGEILVQLENGTFIDPTLQTITPIKTDNKLISFKMTGSDEQSGLQKISIETDEGNLLEFDSDAETTIPFLEYGVHDVYFRVYDKSGNFYEVSFSLNLTEPEDPQMGPVPYPFGLISIIGLVALAAIYLRKRK
jgi:hypothetical protein